MTDQRVSPQRGFTLVELMVAMVIGMVLVLAIATILKNHAQGRRTITSNNDASMAANFTSFTLDQHFRDAGTDFSYTRNGVAESFGCELNVARAGAQILPSTAAFPAPFTAVFTDQRLAPIVIYPGIGANGSDVISVASGASGLSGVMMNVLAKSATATDLRVNSNTVGVKASDLMLLNDNGRCALQQVAASFTGGATDRITFGGTYAGATVGTVVLSSVGATGGATVANLGNATSFPRFMLYGINNDSELVTYDLLQLNGLARTEIVSEGLIDLRAVYGIDSDGDWAVNFWVRPTAAATDPYSPASLVGVANPAGLRRIVAVRIGVVVRGDLIEATTVSPENYTMFQSVGLPMTSRTLTGDDLRYRTRSIEFTVPLRNLINKS